MKYKDYLERIKKYEIDTGKWKYDEDMDVLMFRCPYCNGRYYPGYYFTKVYNFCPYCGKQLISEQLNLFEVIEY